MILNFFDAFQYNPTGTAWTYGGSEGVAGNNSGFTSGNPNAPEGVQVGFLQGTGSFSQSVNLIAGGYSLSFLAAQRGNWNQGGQTLQVLVDGNAVGTFAPAGTGYALYTTTSFAVASGAHTITFVGTNPLGGDNTAFVDQVQLGGNLFQVSGTHTYTAATSGTVSVTIMDTGGASATVTAALTVHPNSDTTATVIGRVDHGARDTLAEARHHGSVRSRAARFGRLRQLIRQQILDIVLRKIRASLPAERVDSAAQDLHHLMNAVGRDHAVHRRA